MCVEVEVVVVVVVVDMESLPRYRHLLQTLSAFHEKVGMQRRHAVYAVLMKNRRHVAVMTCNSSRSCFHGTHAPSYHAEQRALHLVKKPSRWTRRKQYDLLVVRLTGHPQSVKPQSSKPCRMCCKQIRQHGGVKRVIYFSTQRTWQTEKAKTICSTHLSQAQRRVFQRL